MRLGSWRRASWSERDGGAHPAQAEGTRHVDLILHYFTSNQCRILHSILICTYLRVIHFNRTSFDLTGFQTWSANFSTPPPICLCLRECAGSRGTEPSSHRAFWHHRQHCSAGDEEAHATADFYVQHGACSPQIPGLACQRLHPVPSRHPMPAPARPGCSELPPRLCPHF